MPSGRRLVAASAVGVAVAAAPSASAEPVANCTSDVIDGVEVDYCVGDPNADTVAGVPGVTWTSSSTWESGSASDPIMSPGSTESKTLSDCSNGSEVTPSSFPNGWSSQKTMNSRRMIVKPARIR